MFVATTPWELRAIVTTEVGRFTNLVLRSGALRRRVSKDVFRTPRPSRRLLRRLLRTRAVFVATTPWELRAIVTTEVGRFTDLVLRSGAAGDASRRTLPRTRRRNLERPSRRLLRRLLEARGRDLSSNAVKALGPLRVATRGLRPARRLLRPTSKRFQKLQSLEKASEPLFQILQFPSKKLQFPSRIRFFSMTCGRYGGKEFHAPPLA